MQAAGMATQYFKYMFEHVCICLRLFAQLLLYVGGHVLQPGAMRLTSFVLIGIQQSGRQLLLDRAIMTSSGVDQPLVWCFFVLLKMRAYLAYKKRLIKFASLFEFCCLLVVYVLVLICLFSCSFISFESI
jgi:hypothetical protein